MSHTKELAANKLKVRIYDTRTALGIHAAKDVAEKLRKLLAEHDTVNMIFAAAPSQNEFLAALAVEKDIAWERVNAFHMDEYIGLDDRAPQRFGLFLRERLFDKVPFREVFYINGNANPQEECSRYSALLRKYPADIVCMGIGENGHIAFNDPHVADFHDPLAVKVVKLSEASRYQQVHDECFESIDEVPVAAITLTIPALVNGNFLYCMVPAATKARAVYHTLHAETGEQCPSTVLREHDNATLYLDKDSASELKL